MLAVTWICRALSYRQQISGNRSAALNVSGGVQPPGNSIRFALGSGQGAGPTRFGDVHHKARYRLRDLVERSGREILC